MTTISGELIYRERIALIPGGTATITLSDVALQDDAAPVIAETTIELEDKQVPIPFELTFEAPDSAPNATYSVRATISGPDGKLEWTTDTVNMVDIDQGSVNVGELMLVRANLDETEAADASILVGEWNVTTIDGTPVIEGSTATLVFDADGSLGGNASCNSYSTTYAATGSEFSIDSPIAATLMACEPPAADQEQAFLEVLNGIEADDAASFEIVDTGARLILTSSTGKSIEATR